MEKSQNLQKWKSDPKGGQLIKEPELRGLLQSDECNLHYSTFKFIPLARLRLLHPMFPRVGEHWKFKTSTLISLRQSSIVFSRSPWRPGNPQLLRVGPLTRFLGELSFKIPDKSF